VASNHETNKTEDMLAAESAGKDLLLAYYKGGYRRLRDLHERTGMHEAFLSRMARDKRTPISMESAIKIELATDGELPAGLLCPSCADLVAQFVALRMVKAVA
jgi:hypothetical protein